LKEIGVNAKLSFNSDVILNVWIHLEFTQFGLNYIHKRNQAIVKRTLLFTQRSSDFTEMLRLAVALNAAKAYEPIIFFANSSHLNFRTDVEQCKKAGIRCIDAQGKEIHLTGSGPAKEADEEWGDGPNPLIKEQEELRVSDQLPENFDVERSKLGVVSLVKHWIIKNHPNIFRIKSELLFIIVDFINKFKKNIYNKSVILFNDTINLNRAVIENNNIRILVLAEDTVGPTTSLFIKAGHDLGVPSVIMPYTIANAREPAEHLLNSDELSTRKNFTNFVFGMLFPKWKYKHKRKSLLRISAPYIFAHFRTHTVPPDPWTLNSGYVDAIAVESKAMNTYYKDNGLPSHKLHLTGAAYDDQIASNLRDRDARREKLFRSFGLRLNKGMILLAAPPNQVDPLRDDFEFEDFDECVKFVASELAQYTQNFNVVVRPHPNFPDTGKIYEHYGLTVCYEDTASLVPLCDFFIASASATIRWAIACGIPTLNFDIYHYHYIDYKAVPGVQHIDTRGTFSHVLKTWVENPSALSEARLQQIRVKDDWGNYDGNLMKKIVELFDDLIETTK
jgi:hypothetical protein